MMNPNTDGARSPEHFRAPAGGLERLEMTEASLVSVVKGSERVDEGVKHLVVDFVGLRPFRIVGVIVPRARRHDLESGIT